MNDKDQSIIVIMAGGKGERFWPRSRMERPKQTLAIGSDKPLLVETIERINKITDKIFISTGKSLEKPFKELLKDFNIDYLIEPLGRDTAAAIGYCCHILEKKFGSDHSVAFIGSDYLIPEKELFQKHLEAAFQLATKENVIVTLGIKPTRPATAYGYIQEGENLSDPVIGIKASKVKGFREKPNRETAIKYIDDGGYFWNSGMFMTKIGVMIEEIEKFIPAHHEAFVRMKKNNFNPDLVHGEFEKLEKISIDFAVMEKTSKIAMIKSVFRWDDLGDWLAYARVSEKDERNNVIRGTWDGLKTEDCVVYNDTNKIVATIGVKDLIIINTEDAIMICHKNEAQNVKKLVQRLGDSEEFKSFV
jgi:mannose-1-phosphate guanylyltransferase